MNELGFKSTEGVLSGQSWVIVLFVSLLVLGAALLRSKKGKKLFEKGWQGKSIVQWEAQQLDRDTRLYKLKSEDKTYLVVARNGQMLLLESTEHRDASE